ncbi:hypothetical protein Cni_G10194 [Canna indica]|uniref:Uncharacterized protein n=1 Tax=Canna indica TaxID=4628 RepID=A0AAQ3K655_9LILI|nr:hypothetical protein Cni_G10194 [Canna indica]
MVLSSPSFNHLCFARCLQYKSSELYTLSRSSFNSLKIEILFGVREPVSALSIDIHNLWAETLKQQYHIVKSTTSVDGTYSLGSHVMQYEEIGHNLQIFFLYLEAVAPFAASVHTFSVNPCSSSWQTSMFISSESASPFY